VPPSHGSSGSRANSASGHIVRFVFYACNPMGSMPSKTCQLDDDVIIDDELHRILSALSPPIEGAAPTALLAT
jgi:hypothetical protein